MRVRSRCISHCGLQETREMNLPVTYREVVKKTASPAQREGQALGSQVTFPHSSVFHGGAGMRELAVAGV